MRLALAFAALVCAGSAAAEPVQDRYGPPRQAVSPRAVGLQAASAQARAYEGRLLGWAGKAAVAAPPVQAQVSHLPEPVRPASEPLQPPSRAVAAAPAPPPPSRAQAPAPAPAALAALPQSLYDAPPPQAAPAPQLAAAPASGPQRGAAPSRLYSLHREYGLTPDVAPAVPARTQYVLIGPADAPAEADDASVPARKPPVDARLF